MKLFGFILINNRRGKYAVVDIKRRVREVYIKSDNESCYATYRAITGATVQESWKYCKPLIKLWSEEAGAVS